MKAKKLNRYPLIGLLLTFGAFVSYAFRMPNLSLQILLIAWLTAFIMLLTNASCKSEKVLASLGLLLVTSGEIYLGTYSYLREFNSTLTIQTIDTLDVISDISYILFAVLSVAVTALFCCVRKSRKCKWLSILATIILVIAILCDNSFNSIFYSNIARSPFRVSIHFISAIYFAIWTGTWFKNTRRSVKRIRMKMKRWSQNHSSMRFITKAALWIWDVICYCFRQLNIKNLKAFGKFTWGCFAFAIAIVAIVWADEYYTENIHRPYDDWRGDRIGWFYRMVLEKPRQGTYTLWDIRSKTRVEEGILWTAKSEDRRIMTYSYREKNGTTGRGYLNLRTGKIIKKGHFTNAWVFSEGKAIYRYCDSLYCINTDGQTLFSLPYVYEYTRTGLDYDYNVGYCFKNGLCIVRGDDGKYGAVNESGEWVIAPQYQLLSHRYDDDYLTAYSSEGKGLVDTSGTVICNPIYDAIEIDNGHFYATRNKQMFSILPGGIESDELPVTEVESLIYIASYNALFDDDGDPYPGAPIYKSANCLQYTLKDDKIGLMDLNGNKVTEAKYDLIEAVTANLFKCYPVDSIEEFELIAVK